MTYDDDLYPPEMRAADAVSAIVALTAKQIAKRAGVPTPVASKVLKRMVENGDVEARDRRYRIGNGAQWVICKEDLPMVGVGHGISFDSSIKGYKVEFPPPRPKVEAPVASEAPSRPAPKPVPAPRKEGQIEIFE